MACAIVYNGSIWVYMVAILLVITGLWMACVAGAQPVKEDDLPYSTEYDEQLPI